MAAATGTPEAANRRSRLLGLLRERAADAAEPERVLAILLLVAFVMRAVWITVPAGSLIFDEAYYVNAARIILGWPVQEGAHYAGAVAGLDPNSEHPPLGKLLIAGSMFLFGDGGLGWRLPSIIAAMVALAAVYWIVRAAGESRWLGVAAVGFFAFDNLAFVHGRIGTLDMLVLAPLLLGAWAGLRRRWLLAGALTGLAMLVKLTALYGLLALLVYQAFVVLGAWRRERRIVLAELWPSIAIVGSFVVVTLAGLWIMDPRFSSYTNPIDHLRHMFEYGANLTKAGGPPSDCSGNDSAPWQWLANNCQMNYLRTVINVTAGGEIVGSTVKYAFLGLMNPVLVGTLWLAVPFAGWMAWRRQHRLAAWSAIWMASSYLPYIPLAVIGHRITYIYYFLPVVPALGVAVAILLLRSGLPRAVAYVYVVAYVLACAALFPFRQIP